MRGSAAKRLDARRSDSRRRGSKRKGYERNVDGIDKAERARYEKARRFDVIRVCSAIKTIEWIYSLPIRLSNKYKRLHNLYNTCYDQE